MNYIVENEIDFFKELDKSDDENIQQEELCCITGMPLERNYIKLQCNHCYNYSPLFNEIKIQKSLNVKNSVYLMANEVQCPYCRKISKGLLPYVDGYAKIKGVNAPDKFAMPHKVCNWKYMRGKNRGCLCMKQGFETEHGDFCEKHWKMYKNQNVKNHVWNEQMQEMFSKTTVKVLQELLREKKMKVSGNKKDLVIRLLTT